ncbi:hypothetical protein [Streptomyces hydrogenans]|uniref:hypothetical protein n=1 Tax=Streptomyces hydrogenans TaxID=1873719 RepID=UPI0037FC856A
MPERTQHTPPTVTHPASLYTAAAQADHEAHCDRCRTLTEPLAARRAANAASIARRDRIQLGLILDMTTKAVTPRG